VGFQAFYARDKAGWLITSWPDANKLLSYLDPLKRSYATFGLADGSYVQCAGSKTRLTVEARLIEPGGRFHHFVFGRGHPTGVSTEIACAVGPITVDETQVLRMRDARQIIRTFVEQRAFHPRYHAQDVSGRFPADSRTS
jgi:hypothetical protein